MVTSIIPRQPVRQFAHQILCRVETSGDFADQLIATLTAAQRLTPQARGFLRELTYGVLRWRNRLDWMLQQCSDRHLEALTPAVRNLLRLGAYQLCFMDHLPPYAAVSETVQLAKQIGHSGVVAYVNAVLRALERQRGAMSPPEADTDLLAYLTITQSHPRWLVDRWLRHYGSQQTIAMCQANNVRPPLVVRVNRRRATRQGLLDSLLADGCEAEPCRYAPDGVFLRSHAALEQLQSYRDGWFTVQDEAAILCGYLLTPQPGQRVLDACAAPGGKATHAAELMADSSEILCLDHSQQRLNMVLENARRLGLRGLQRVVGKAETMEFKQGFDRILIDAPCSGLGVLRRHPDAKWRKGPELIGMMARRQASMLAHLSQFMKPDGLLLYTTCSTEAEENQDLVNEFLECHADYQLDMVTSDLPEAARVFAREEGWFQTWPGPESLDGFFGARLRRSGSITRRRGLA
jgi:16S rRNA (cytosine967-C5)-methyltransferase